MLKIMERKNEFFSTKNLITQGVLILTLLFMTASSSHALALIGSWEDSTNEGWYDFPTAAANGYNADPNAWVDDPCLLASGEYAFDSSWSTAGSKSLKVKLTGASGTNNWGNKLVVSVKNDWFKYTQLEMDINASSEVNDWAQIIAINMNAQSTSDGSRAMVGGDWVHFPWQSGDAQHYVLDTTPFRGDGWANTTDGWVNICFQIQGSGYLYFDNVRLTTPIAHLPSPADGVAEPNLTPILSWTAGDYTQSANGHNVYFGADFDDVNDANTTDTSGIYLGNTTNTTHSITTPLAIGTTYYWRVDEVNAADGNSPWKGDVWSFKAVSAATITKCTIAAGKTQYADDNDFNNMKDSITLSGTTTFLPDANKATQLDVNIISVTDSYKAYSQTITDFNSYLDTKGTKISYSHKLTKNKAGEITSLKMDFVKGTFSLTAKNVDLTGLSAPVKLELIMKDINDTIVNESIGEVNETIINGKKYIPTRLMRQYQDTLVATKATPKHSTKAGKDTLSLTGEIAVLDINDANLNDPNLIFDDVNVIWGNDANEQTFKIPAGNFKAAKKSHSYNCSKIATKDVNDVTNGKATAKIDLDKCTFTMTITEVNNIDINNVSTPFGITFGVSGDAIDFDKAVDVNMITKRSN